MARFTPTGIPIIGGVNEPTPQPETDTRVNPSVDQAARDALNGTLTPEQLAALPPEVRQRMVQIQIEEDNAANAAAEEAANSAAAARGEAGALGTSSTSTSSTPTPPVASGTSTNLTGSQAVEAYIRSLGVNPNVQINQPATPQWVIRPGASQRGVVWDPSKLPESATVKNGIATIPKTSTLDEYYGEYGEKINDPTFRDWLYRRVAVVFNKNVDDSTLTSLGLSAWKFAGDMVASNPTLKKTMTPEQWLDMQYGLAGGDSMFDKLQEEAKPNPITTSTETTTYTITAAQAQSLVDDLSRGLLGRMASDAERKAARRSINKLLTPTVRTTVTDATDPNNVTQKTSVNQGVTPSDAQGILEMRMRRGSEGMAFNVGKMFDEAMAKMA